MLKEVLGDCVCQEFAFESQSQAVFEGFDEAGVLELGYFITFVTEQFPFYSGVSPNAKREDFGLAC